MKHHGMLLMTSVCNSYRKIIGRVFLSILITGGIFIQPLHSQTLQSQTIHRQTIHSDDPIFVDLELVLAIDVSHSVDDYEASLQRLGYIDAFKSPSVIRSIRSGPLGRIAVTYIEWAGEHHQVKVIDWTILNGTQSAHSFSNKLAKLPISSAPSTSISSLIDVAAYEIQNNRYYAARSVIDISGDGPNSNGRQVRLARDQAITQGITINGLPVLSSRPNPNGLGAPSVWLASYYLKNVIGGENAFLIEVFEFEAFSEVLQEKLKREIRGTSQISSRTPDLFTVPGFVTDTIFVTDTGHNF